MDPPPPRPLKDIWDVNIVLSYLDKLPPNEDLPLMLLNQKTLVLVLISTMRRRCDVMGMRVDNYYFQPNSMVFSVRYHTKDIYCYI